MPNPARKPAPPRKQPVPPQLAAHSFKHGNPGGPGRPKTKGAAVVVDKLLDLLAAKHQISGSRDDVAAAVLQTMMLTQPKAIGKVVAERLLPPKPVMLPVALQHLNFKNMSDDQLADNIQAVVEAMADGGDIQSLKAMLDALRTLQEARAVAVETKALRELEKGGHDD